MFCPICYFVRFAIQPREWKNLENKSKNVENAFENDLKTSRKVFPVFKNQSILEI